MPDDNPEHLSDEFDYFNELSPAPNQDPSHLGKDWEMEYYWWDKRDWRALVRCRKYIAECYPDSHEAQWELGEAYVLNAVDIGLYPSILRVSALLQILR
jgi:hypothetical protein